jgi:three-Cys-motif partner protein
MTTPRKVVDPADGLVADEVGYWADEKHERLRRYIDVSRGARAKFLPPKNDGGAAYIELFAGSGRAKIRENGKFVDGSPLVALKAAIASGAQFSELHFNDLDPEKIAALDSRVRAAGRAANIYNDPADQAVDKIVDALNPYGLHFAFLDPFNLDQLPFSIIRKLARLSHMDLLIHVSVQDLQRNLDQASRPGGALDIFMPAGWRDHVNLNQAIKPLRAALLEYWLEQIRSLNKEPSKGVELVVGSKNQRLYWLVFVSGHDLGQKLWNAVRDLHGQTEMGL